ncbi:MAG TPA: DMT family transporter [Flavobacterium sp.]|nr:DMT family transporter [Flavobacterium sp.]
MNALTKGILFVAFGASSYGMLATFVKLAYQNGYTTAEVTISQFLLGIIIVSFLNYFFTKNTPKASKSDIKKLMISGTSMGFTSVLYYLCVKYLNASVAVVLLMQSVWIGVLIETIQTRKIPSTNKIIAVIMVLFGTLLATNSLSSEMELNTTGLLFGILSSISFSMTLFTTNSVATHLAPFKRTLYMLFGGAIIVFIFAFITQLAPTYLNINLLKNSDISVIKSFDWNILYTYGLLLSLFGTVLPPIFLNKGFPLTGVGIGSIVSAIELPVSATFAFLVLSEPVVAIQWLGIFIILVAIVLMNIQWKNKLKSLV